MANFKPLANGASQGNYFLAKIQKMAVFDAKTGLQKLQRQPKLQTFFDMVSIFELVRDEAKNFRNMVSGARARQKKYCRFSLQIDRQSDKFFDTIYGGVWNFSSSQICYLPTRLAGRG